MQHLNYKMVKQKVIKKEVESEVVEKIKAHELAILKRMIEKESK